MIKRTLFYTFIFGSIALVIFLLPLVIGFGKTGKNTYVLNRDFSLLSKSEIFSRVAADFKLSDSISLLGPDHLYILKLSDISAEINTGKIANDLLFRRLNQGVGNYIKAFFSPKHFTLEVAYDDAALDKYLDDLNTQINQPFIPSELNIVNGKVEVKVGQSGRKIDTVLLKMAIINALENYQLTNALVIPLQTIGNLPDQNQMNTAQSLAQTFIKKSFVFTGADSEITADNNTLVSLIGFDSVCNQGKIIDYVNNLSNSIHKDPVDATLKVDGNKVSEFKPSADGYSLNTDEFTKTLCSQLELATKSTDTVVKFPLTLNYVSPKIKTSEVNNLGIKELLGSGTSTFRHSSAIRNLNVERGASMVNRVLVAPNETFSFLKALGEVSVENGYKMAYVIRGGKTELDVGGGICQVSTTLFRAMLNSGLDITQRQNHAYRVQYYEEDMPPGYDATVFIPSPDLRFINDTGHYLLIQSKYNGVEKRLTYEIYGTSDGRKVDISGYRQWGWAPAPPDINIDDPTLPPGKTVKDEQAIPGLKTSFDWKVTRGGEIIRQKTFTSSYTPWAAVYRHGPQP